MGRTRRSLVAATLTLVMIATGGTLWLLHANAWGLGGRSPVLNYDTSQYALAARELASHGRLATTFALPLELSRHARPPWPLAVVQPGLVLVEAAIFKLAPREASLGGRQLAHLYRPDEREWLVLLLPILCYLAIATLLAFAASRLLRRHAPDLPGPRRTAAAFTLGFMFLLDPEAQHFATSGFTELPFTLGLLAAVVGLAFGWAPRRPLLFGLLLGVTGSFRANMLWLAPVLALAAAMLAPRGRRLRVLVFALSGCVLPLVPWWWYKWRAFGSPSWDLTRFVVWDGVEGRTWFSLYHLPELPPLPAGFAAAKLLAAKTLRNLPALLLASLTGPRALWLGAIVAWLVALRPPRALAVPALAVLAAFGLSLALAAVSIPWLRYVFPARVACEAAGLLALWALVARLQPPVAPAAAARALHIVAALLALGWGGFQSARANAEAAATSQERGVPGTLTLLQISVLMNREIPAGEPVMSNLGPALAWQARRPVLHLALSPGDLESCRRRLEFRHVLLVFRDPSRAWPGWTEVVAHPEQAVRNPEWNLARVRVWRSEDGFSLVWFELGPPAVRLAER
ncbi:MAG: hypothetical protein HZC42_06305 [Candidatus Eisenbacteria bacterium]|nr:hypothetical protein [Candidatus Eisenbacteria bacterium]